VEFKAIVEIFLGSRVLYKHQQGITSWVRSNKSQLQSTIHRLLPHQNKVYGVKKDVPRMETVHHQDVTVELSPHLLAAQREIETLCIQLWNSDATIRGYMRKVDGQSRNLYTSNIDTRSATSTMQGSGKELTVDSHSPSRSCTR
jgi:hypothetical protein